MLTKLLACGAACTLVAAPATAATINIGLVVDESGSVSGPDFATIKGAIRSVLLDPDLIPGNNQVSFDLIYTGTTARTVVPLTAINTTSRAAISTAIAASYQYGGATCLGCGVSKTVSDFSAAGAAASFQFIDVIAQGVNTVGSVNAATNAALLGGVDQVSCINIGAVGSCSGLVGGPGSSESDTNPAGLQPALRSLIKSQIDFASAPAVPEPATWGMMILGMGAIGFAMRRRQKISARVTFV